MYLVNKDVYKAFKAVNGLLCADCWYAVKLL